MLYQELAEFLRVMEDVAYNLDIKLSIEIYEEQKRGFESFFNTYHDRRDHDVEWIGKIWKHQMIYLEQIDMLIETLKTRGKVFDYSERAFVYSDCLLLPGILGQRQNRVRNVR